MNIQLHSATGTNSNIAYILKRSLKTTKDRYIVYRYDTTSDSTIAAPFKNAEYTNEFERDYCLLYTNGGNKYYIICDMVMQVTVTHKLSRVCMVSDPETKDKYGIHITVGNGGASSSNNVNDTKLTYQNDDRVYEFDSIITDLRKVIVSIYNVSDSVTALQSPLAPLDASSYIKHGNYELSDLLSSDKCNVKFDTDYNTDMNEALSAVRMHAKSIIDIINAIL